MKLVSDLKSKKDLIEALREVFLTARQIQLVYKKDFDVKNSELTQEELKKYSLNNEDFEKYNEQINRTLNLFLSKDDEDQQIQKLQMIIENIIFKEFEELGFVEKETNNDLEEETNNSLKKQKIIPKNLLEEMKKIKKYYLEVIKKIDKISDKNFDEKIFINLYKESIQLNIHVDVEKEEKFKYGDFFKIGKNSNLILYKDENISLTRISDYQTRKSSMDERNPNIIKLASEEISKYRVEIMYKKGETVSIEFFAETSMGNKILHNRSKKAFKLMLAAACEAKARNRNFIGRIYCINKELGTFITTYDDNLEEKIKILLEREQKALELNYLNKEENDKEERRI